MAYLKFDVLDNPILPTFVLAKRSGDKIGIIPCAAVNVSEDLMNPNTITFNVNKFLGDEKCPIWDEITDFRLVWCEEWLRWYQISVDVDESTETVKRVNLTSLCEAELSQLSLNEIEINTENDIDRPDYEVARLWDGTENSILARILHDKASHYTVKHVDSTIANMQRMFSFSHTTIYDAFVDIQAEIGCLFVYGETDQPDVARQAPVRTISVYDMQSNCLNSDCLYRGEFVDICPECGSNNIKEGYGTDTTIFVDSEYLADNITFTTDTDSIKNCFLLTSGDEDMDAVIRSANPSGTNYLYYFSDEMIRDMSSGLKAKIADYQEDYDLYSFNNIYWLGMDEPDNYNALIRKYLQWFPDLKTVSSTPTGYAKLNQILYEAIDFEMFLSHEMMPDVTLSDTNATTEANKLTSSSLSPVSVNDFSQISQSSAENAVLGMAKVLVDSRYKIEIVTTSYSKGSKTASWSGNFKITSYYDEDDTATSSTANVTINDDYLEFVRQKIDKVLAKENSDDVSIVGLFKKNLDDFSSELKLYSLSSLKRFYDCAEGALGVMQEQGIATNPDSIGYDTYNSYLAKQSKITSEIKTRDTEIDTVQALIEIVYQVKDTVSAQLDIKTYLGSYWEEFCSFRRDGEYTNENYISDGLDNQELFENATLFLKAAREEIYKSAELQHSISASLRNLIAIKEFRPLMLSFDVGNWIRVRVDNKVYKLRLIHFDVDFDNFSNISVEFSDVLEINSSVSDLKDILEKAQKMGTTFDAVARQADKSEKTTDRIESWFTSGLDLTMVNILNGADEQTQVWNQNGSLFRKWDDITQSYYPEQMKIINSTLAITKDNWRTVDTAVGLMYYVDPITNEVVKTYGVNATTLVGDVIVGSTLKMRNADNTMVFDHTGLNMESSVGEITLNPETGLYMGKDSSVVIRPNGYVNLDNKLVYDPTTSKLDVVANSVSIGGNDVVTSIADARKVATNFMDYDSTTGLQIGNKISGSWSGTRTRITSSSFDIVDASSQTLATFGQNTVIGDDVSSRDIGELVSSDLKYHGMFMSDSSLKYETYDSGYGCLLDVNEMGFSIGVTREIDGYKHLAYGIQIPAQDPEATGWVVVDGNLFNVNCDSNIYGNAYIRGNVTVDNSDVLIQGFSDYKSFAITRSLDTSSSTADIYKTSIGITKYSDSELRCRWRFYKNGSEVNYISLCSDHTYVSNDFRIEKSLFVGTTLDVSSAINVGVGSISSTPIYSYVKKNNVNYRVGLSTAGEGQLYLTYANDSTGSMEVKNYMTMMDDKTSLHRPLTLSSGGTGQSSTESSTTATSIVTASTGITISNVHYAKWGKVMTLRVQFVSSSDITTGASKSLTIGTLSSGNRPAVNSPLNSTSRGISGYVNSNGNITINYVPATVTANTSITLASTYVLS